MEDDISNLKKEFEEDKGWGILSVIDLHSCNTDFIRDESKIKEFVIELCDKIKMKRFGETITVHFGEDKSIEGYSAVQLIETSLISAHFVNQTNNIFLDVFSCKFYNPKEVAEFTKEFFSS